MNKKFKIANTELKNRYILAPLAGFTDYSLRKLCNDYGASLVYTEMESCESLYYGSKITLKDLEDTHLDKQFCCDSKLALQIFGGNEDIILKSIPLFEKYAQYDFLDFNCGCPVPKVVKQHAGSFWLNREDDLIKLLTKMVSISSKPVTIKIRIGFNEIMDIVSFTKKIQDTGVSMIAVHGRTRKEMFSSKVHYDVIREIKDHLDIPVVANGEISQNNIKEVEKITNADAFMIGQHALGYPKIFQDFINIENNKPILENTLQSQLNDLKKHINLMYEIKDEHTASSILRGIAGRYLKGIADIKKYRNLLVQCKSKEEYLNIIKDIENNEIR